MTARSSRAPIAQLDQTQGWVVVFNLTSQGSGVFNNIASEELPAAFLVAGIDLDGQIILKVRR